MEELVLDPRAVAVFVMNNGAWELSRDIYAVHEEGAVTQVTFAKGGQTRIYPFKRGRVCVGTARQRTVLGSSRRARVNGDLWRTATEVCTFDGPAGSWSRVFYRNADGSEKFSDRPACDVEILDDAAASTAGAPVFEYWRRVVDALGEGDPLRASFAEMGFVDPDSALGRLIDGQPIVRRAWEWPLVFPFSCNRSQREAVGRALTNSVSVIDGPPGTGKTQTILNLIANIVTFAPGAAIGVVSFNNAAVDNVGEKLARAGIGYLAGALGNQDKRTAFFADQARRNAELDAYLRTPPPDPPAIGALATLDSRLDSIQLAELRNQQLRGELAAYRLEQRHFQRHMDRRELPALPDVPLLHRSADVLLEFLADAEMSAHRGRVGRLARRVRGYFKYGSTKEISPEDIDTVLGLQAAFYARRIEEIERELARATAELERDGYERLADDHRRLSGDALHAALHHRYGQSARVSFAADGYRRGSAFKQFIADYPVMLSTCHSLRRSIASEYLLDYLVIDEASQVDLPTAALALASCRNVIVVGDLQQLQHIVNDRAAQAAGSAPHPSFDYRDHNILSSMIARYGNTLPRTMLREHYRCDPAIIGFCNTKFYGGQLVPIAAAGAAFDPKPLMVYRTVEGNHERSHAGGGRSNQREVDVILNEVLPGLIPPYERGHIGATTPYRRQANALFDQLIEAVEGIEDLEADTVHKFQGREKDVIIMTTVLSETSRGHAGLTFADDSSLVNVAVSRAARKFVLVTNHDMLPKSRNLRDLIDYIAYQDPDDDVVDSQIVSMFDLLYKEYSAKLRPLARRLRGEMKYKSEDIIWTRLNELLGEPRYRDLDVAHHVYMASVIASFTDLTEEQAKYIKNRASFDFVVYSRVGRRPAFAVEVDGIANHPENSHRDRLKNEICAAVGLKLVRLPTSGSGEEARLRSALDAALGVGS